MKIEDFENNTRIIIKKLLSQNKLSFKIKDFNRVLSDKINTYERLNKAFLTLLSHEVDDPLYLKAIEFFEYVKKIKKFKQVAEFYLKGKSLIFDEISRRTQDDIKFNSIYKKLVNLDIDGDDKLKKSEIIEKFWELFFPEGTGILGFESDKVNELRVKRKIKVSVKNSDPIKKPAEEILFSSNIMLTTPIAERMNEADSEKFSKIHEAASIAENEKQLYWYDHPIPIGISPENNEILYGLKNLDKFVGFEKEQDSSIRGKLTVVLSISVTHKGLQKLAKDYVASILEGIEPLKNLEIYAFTEEDCKKIINNIINPAAVKYFSKRKDKSKFSIFGVDGKYGRHYSFLKAIAAFWNVFIDKNKKATFKIDLDQVFPQEKIVKETGSSVFQKFKTSLWGAEGISGNGKTIELGMIAGSLVNFEDINKSLFSADIKFPEGKRVPEDFVFYSFLPQALSTEAEMLTRYNTKEIDGERNCIQRIHVTGGTNGILVKYLFKYRPFTPGFIGRAEDQAYLLSVMGDQNKRLGYVHRPGLIMRHDKHIFAQEAIKKASVGKLVGDYLRILYFSSYAKVISKTTSNIKDELDPFTGCFVSEIPVTVVYMRFALKIIHLFKKQNFSEIESLVEIGIPRIILTIKETFSNESIIKKSYLNEKEEWNLFYDIFEILNKHDLPKDSFLSELSDAAVSIVNNCKIN